MMFLTTAVLLVTLHSVQSRSEQVGENTSYLFRLFDYHRLLTRFNKSSGRKNKELFDSGYNSTLYETNRFRSRADEGDKKEGEKEGEKEMKNKTFLDEDDMDNGLSNSLRKILKDIKKHDKKPYIPLHSIPSMSFNDKEQLKSQSCTTIL